MDKVALIPAVECLLKAIDNEEVLDPSIQLVKDALGYDPTIKEQDYLIKLEIDLYAKTPQEAVKLFINMLEEEDPTGWVYRVIAEDNTETLVDGWNLKEHPIK